MKQKTTSIAKKEDTDIVQSTGLFGLIDKASEFINNAKEETQEYDKHIVENSDQEIKLLKQILAEMKKINKKLMENKNVKS